MRFRTRRRFYIDDILVLISVLSLAAATGVLYHYIDLLYLIEAGNTENIIPTTAEIMPMLGFMKWNDIYCALVWTSIFAIKFAFLSFFYPLLLSMSKRINVYYWFVLGFNILCWMFLPTESFIICPHFGLDALQYCYQGFSHKKSLALNILAGCLDIISDAMIIAIPILILRGSLMKRAQKIGLAVFLCLSLAMVIVTLVRMIGTVIQTKPSNRGTSPVWGTLFMIVEAGIAVIMSSLLVFRGVFLERLQRSSQGSSAWSSISRALRYVPERLNCARDEERFGQPRETDEGAMRIPTQEITKPTLSHIFSFFRRRDDGLDSQNVRTLAPDTNHTLDSEVPEMNYHDFARV